MTSPLDLLVGIDVGMSCTGVAYINLTKSKPDPSAVRVMRRWEGRIAESKVPTVVVYEKDSVEKGPTSWGFKTEMDTERGQNRAMAYWFKKQFGPPKTPSLSGGLQSDDASVEGGLPPVDTLYCDFLRKLYGHIMSEFPETVFTNGASWATAKVEFIFSVPATWDSATVGRFVKIARDAGFGEHPDTPEHSIGPCLTEPQSVAVFAVKEEEKTVEAGDNVLIVDAGGGTADLCLVRIESKNNGRVSLSELRPVEGEDIGSTYIDAAFQDLVLQKLKKIGRQRLGGKSLNRLSWEMMTSPDFQNNKHTLGRPGADYPDDEAFYIKIPAPIGEGNRADLQDVTEGGEMKFLWGELIEFFNEQTDRIKGLMDEMVDSLHMQITGSSNIDHIIFSGGLGGSPYIQNRLKRAYRDGTALSKARFHGSSDPQLCVCKGLVMNRLEKMKTGSSAFNKLCARTSLGILKQEKFNRFKSSHRVAMKENKAKILNNQITVPRVDWFILRGEAHDAERTIDRSYQMRFITDARDASLHGHITIVASPEEAPPTHFTNGNTIQELARIAYDFQGLGEANLHTKRRRWYNKAVGQKPYKEVDFVISAKLGSAEVNFECLTSKQNGIKLNQDNPIPIEVDTQSVEASDAILL